MKTIKLLIVSLVVLMASCSAPKLGYFQDVESGQVQQLPAAQIIRIQPGDKLSILVSSKNPELAYLYNKSRWHHRFPHFGLDKHSRDVACRCGFRNQESPY